MVSNTATTTVFRALFGTTKTGSRGAGGSSEMAHPDARTPDEWRAVLSREQFRILREKGTEPAGSGVYDKHYPAEGVYACAGCSAPLYRATHKFKSGCGWPAYYDSIPGAVRRREDRQWGLSRTEIVCARCGGHLGHVFKGEGFATPTDERHCVNSVSLTFAPDDAMADQVQVQVQQDQEQQQQQQKQQQAGGERDSGDGGGEEAKPQLQGGEGEGGDDKAESKKEQKDEI